MNFFIAKLKNLAKNKKTMISIEKLRKYEKMGKLRSSNHPFEDLSIWNYLETVHFKDDWDETTLMCRALVVENKTGRIVGRSFSKFFNMEERKHIPTESFNVYDKADGSLGLLFFYVDKWIFTSRGSFTSEQAIKGKEILEEKYPQYIDLNKEFTYSFEIIYPSNRIVVDYGSDVKLIFLTAFNKEGEESEIRDEMLENGYDAIEKYDFSSMTLKELKSMNIPNHEGFVIKYTNGSRVKVKFEDYVELHKVRTGLNNKKIYDLCCYFERIEDVLQNIPDEFNNWVKNIYDGLLAEYTEIHNQCVPLINREINKKDFFISIKDHELQKFIACLYLKPDTFRSYVYSMLDYKKYKEEGFKKPLPKPPSTIIFLIGRSGSGKTTWTREFMRSNSKTRRVNRDTIRASIFNLEDERDVTKYYQSKDIKKREETVTEVSNSIIKNAIKEGLTVIMDNTNLDEEFIRRDLEQINQDTSVEFKVFGEELTNEELHERIVLRGSMIIPLKIIKQQDIKFRDLLSKLPILPENRVMVQNIDNPLCVVFDIDGTLSLNKSGRSPYDMTRVDEDEGNLHIIDLCKLIPYPIIICSGRDESAREKTIEWLQKFGIPFQELHMRTIGDSRKDSIIKEEFWKDICTRYYIHQMFDDRDQVVNHARMLGFNVNQVAPGNF